MKLMLHFSYHKCMTAYFWTVFSQIAKTNSWYHKHHYGDLNSFYNGVKKRHKRWYVLNKNAILSLNNKAVDFEQLPPYVGVHLIRDPRDLLISGYRYHLWCEEEWTKIPIDKVSKETEVINPGNDMKNLHLERLGLSNISKEESYQGLLNSLSETEGFKVELNWRDEHFKQMEEWNYSNPNILELKYEDVFGNEEKIFENIFRHFDFHPSILPKCLEIVKDNRFESMVKKKETGENKHATFGYSGQWKTMMPDEIKDIFKKRYGNLLIQLGYETDNSW